MKEENFGNEFIDVGDAAISDCSKLSTSFIQNHVFLIDFQPIAASPISSQFTRTLFCAFYITFSTEEYVEDSAIGCLIASKLQMHFFQMLTQNEFV